MEVTEAIAAAKQHVAMLFADEEIAEVGLEEVQFDAESDEWLVTIGFKRPWNRPIMDVNVLTQRALFRAYKQVRISDADGRVVSLLDRILTDH